MGLCANVNEGEMRGDEILLWCDAMTQNVVWCDDMR